MTDAPIDCHQCRKDLDRHEDAIRRHEDELIELRRNSLELQARMSTISHQIDEQARIQHGFFERVEGVLGQISGNIANVSEQVKVHHTSIQTLFTRWDKLIDLGTRILIWTVVGLLAVSSAAILYAYKADMGYAKLPSPHTHQPPK